MRRSTPAICALLLLALSGASPGQEALSAEADAKEAAAIALEIRATLQELHDVRRRFRLASEQHRDALELVQRQISRLQEDLQLVQKSTQEQRHQIELLKQSIAEQDERTATAQAWIDLAVATAKPVAERTVDRIQLGFNTQGNRRASEIRQAVAGLDSADPARRVECFQRICSEIGNEWLPARQVHLANQTIPVDNGNRLEHAWLLGIGSATALFVSENESTIGLWTGSPASPWLLQLEPSVSQQARHTLDTVRERQAPSLTAVPIWFTPTPASSNE